MTTPRVFCLMSTYNRPEMAHRATHLFLEQDYAGESTLVVYDDGDRPAGVCRDCDGHPQLQVTTGLRMKLPVKRNDMMRTIADSDAIYVNWDDDDYHGPDRVRRQVNALTSAPHGIRACLMSPMLYFNSIDGDLKLSTWKSDGNIAFTWDFWNIRNYPDQIDPGSGWKFLDGRGSEIVDIDGGLDFVQVVHAGQRHTPPAFGPPHFTDPPVTAGLVRELLRLR